MGRQRLFSWLTAESGWIEGSIDDGGQHAAAADDDDGGRDYGGDDDDDVDLRCGPEFPLDDGLPSECDGSSFFPCCSK